MRLRAGVVAALVGIFYLVSAGSYYARDHHGLGVRSQDAMRDLRLRASLAETLIREAMLVPGTLFAAQPAPIEAARISTAVKLAFQTHKIVSTLEIAPAGQSSAYFTRTGLAANDDVASQLSKLASREGRFESLGRSIVSIENESIVATQPIQLWRGRSQPDFWGYAKASAGSADMARALRFDELAEQGYSLRLDYAERDAAGGWTLFAVGGDLRGDPINNEINLPQGDRLILRASLPANWNVLSIEAGELILLLMGGILTSLLTYYLLRRRVEMSEQVALRTLQLGQDKEVLESEIELRRQAELLLQDSHALLDSVFEHIPSMIVLKRAVDLTIVRVNRLGESILGQSKTALLGRSSKELFQGDLAERDAETDLLALREGNLVELPEQFIQTPQGAARWVRVKKLALFDGEGKPSHILEIGEDITAQKHLDAALTENLNFVEQLLAAMPSPIFFKDVNGAYMGVNKAFEAFYGTTREAIVGKTVFDIAPQALAEIYDKADRDLLKSGGTQTYEARVKRPDGTEKDVVFFKAVFSSTHAEVGGIVGIVLDVSQQKAAERHVLSLNRTLSVVGKTNEAILRAKSCQRLIQETVEILHETGGFPLAWVYGSADELPALVVIGEHPELASTVTAGLNADAEGSHGDQTRVDRDRCSFFAALTDCDPALEETPSGFDQHGLAHLPLQVAGRRAGGICIVGLAEDLADEEESDCLPVWPKTCRMPWTRLSRSVPGRSRNASWSWHPMSSRTAPKA